MSLWCPFLPWIAASVILCLIFIVYHCSIKSTLTLSEQRHFSDHLSTDVMHGLLAIKRKPHWTTSNKEISESHKRLTICLYSYETNRQYLNPLHIRGQQLECIFECSSGERILCKTAPVWIIEVVKVNKDRKTFCKVQLKNFANFFPLLWSALCNALYCPW